MRTMELCPMWDIYGQSRNLSEDYGLRNVFLVMDKFNKMSEMHQCPHLGHFQGGLRIMNFNLFRLGPTLKVYRKNGKRIRRG